MDIFSHILTAQGTLAGVYLFAVMTGYGVGTNVRYQYNKILNSGKIDLNIVDNSFRVTNNSSQRISCSLTCLFGSVPSLSVL